MDVNEFSAAVIAELANNPECRPSDVDGFVRAAWPIEDSPAEIAQQFVDALAEQRAINSEA